MIHFLMANNHSRRNFLRTVPLAAATAFSKNNLVLAQTPVPRPFKLIPASKFTEALAVMKQEPGNFDFYDDPAMPFTAVLTREEKHTATDFEWHEGRDHILQVIDGSTLYEIGGTPQNARNIKPGEWLAEVSRNSATLTLRKGDILIIPRGTPHRRNTADFVTFYLISTTGK